MEGYLAHAENHSYTQRIIVYEITFPVLRIWRLQPFGMREAVFGQRGNTVAEEPVATICKVCY